MSETRGALSRALPGSIGTGVGVLAALVALLLPALAAAQDPGRLPGPPSPTAISGEATAESSLTPEEIGARSAALADEIAAADAAIPAARSDAERAHLEAVHEALGGIDALLRQQLELAGPAADPAPGTWIPPDDDARSAFVLHQLYEARFEQEREAERRAAALAARREALAAAREQQEEADRKRREARAGLEGAPQGAARARAEQEFRLRQLASRAAQERVHLRTLEVRAAQRAHREAESQPALDERITQMRDALARGEGTTGDGLEALGAREAEIRQSRAVTQRALSTAELRLDAAQKRFSRAADPGSDLLEEIEARSAERDVLRQELELFDDQLERIQAQRLTWQRWDTLLRGRVSREELGTWKTAVADQLDELEQVAQQRRGRGADVERRLDALQARLRALPDDARLRALLKEQRQLLARLLEAERSQAADLAHEQRLSELLLADIRDRTGERDVLGVAISGAEAVRDLWGYEIASVDDSAITVGSLVLALVLAGLGLWVSRRGSGLIGRIAVSRFRLDAGGAHALQTLSFYVLLVSFTLLALRAVHFPLTAFTVLGGALALGLGFGSQNVMNNFISGLILMLERPVRARDIVEVEGNHGTVERIGARSTQIRSTDGRHIIVPNSFFLETNVINWTLSDDLIRTSVSVGVVYGSPTRLVEELIGRVVGEEEKVLKKPEPIIIFDGFGDNSLDFEVFFWVLARSPMERRAVQSRIRFGIDDLFREHGLVIAFPQRDVHLDSVEPIEVRVVSGGSGSDPQPKDQ